MPNMPDASALVESAEKGPLSATEFLKSVLAGFQTDKDVDRSGGREEPAQEPAQENEATLGDLTDQLDERAFGFMLLLLALPCCLPFVYLLPQIVALPMLALAAQLAVGRDAPWLPPALANRKFGVTSFLKVVERASKYAAWFEKAAKPRLLWLSDGVGARIVGALLLIPTASILVPLPATNTLPGIGVAIAALGLIERDGLLIVLGLLIGLCWVGVLAIFGLEAASLLKEWIAVRM